jgi:hypothetical protein
MVRPHDLPTAAEKLLCLFGSRPAGADRVRMTSSIVKSRRNGSALRYQSPDLPLSCPLCVRCVLCLSNELSPAQSSASFHRLRLAKWVHDMSQSFAIGVAHGDPLSVICLVLVTLKLTGLPRCLAPHPYLHRPRSLFPAALLFLQTPLAIER